MSSILRKLEEISDPKILMLLLFTLVLSNSLQNLIVALAAKYSSNEYF